MLQDGLAAAGIPTEISRRGQSGSEFIEIALGDSKWLSIHERYAYGKWAGWVASVIDREGFGRDILRQGKTVDSVVTVVRAQFDENGVTA